MIEKCEWWGVGAAAAGDRAARHRSRAPGTETQSRSQNSAGRVTALRSSLSLSKNGAADIPKGIALSCKGILKFQWEQLTARSPLDCDFCLFSNLLGLAMNFVLKPFVFSWGLGGRKGIRPQRSLLSSHV